MYTIGLSKIEVGDIAADGGMGQSLAPLGLTYQDTCKLNQDDTEDTEFYAEEVDDPVFIMSRAGKTKFTFSIMNPELVTLKETMGGAITGTGDTAKWSPPNQLPVIEKSVRITPQQGIAFDIPRLKIAAKINGEFSKKGLLIIEVTGTVLMPTKTSVKKYEAYKVSVTA
jgi:ribosomal protein L11